MDIGWFGHWLTEDQQSKKIFLWKPQGQRNEKTMAAWNNGEIRNTIEI